MHAPLFSTRTYCGNKVENKVKDCYEVRHSHLQPSAHDKVNQDALHCTDDGFDADVALDLIVYAGP